MSFDSRSHYRVEGTYRAVSYVNEHVQSEREHRQRKYLLDELVGLPQDHCWIDGVRFTNEFFERIQIGDRVVMTCKLKWYDNWRGERRIGVRSAMSLAVVPP
jgi:hypothetical protein